MPFICLLGGMFVCFFTLIGACTGKVWAKFQGWVYRAKEPKWFWCLVAAYFSYWCGFDWLLLLSRQLTVNRDPICSVDSRIGDTLGLRS